MPTADKLTPESRFCALFVGPKHSGKTAAACSWRPDKTKRLKVFDGDGRIRGLLGCQWLKDSLPFIDYDYYPPRTGLNEKTFFERVNNDCDVLLQQVASNKSPYITYVGDSATAFCKNLMIDAIPLTHTKTVAGKDKEVGRRIGTIEMPGPADYGFESTGFDNYLSFLRSLPINVIVTAHTIDKYDKPVDEETGKKDPYAESIVVGEKISLRDKIAANCTIYFDHIFKFDREMVGIGSTAKEKFTVEFINNIACTSFPNLRPGKHDITGKNFFEYVMGLIKNET